MTTYKAELQFSDSGKICIVKATNGRIIAEILVHGPLSRCAFNADQAQAIVPGRANIYRGELYGLAGYEYLNIEAETIEEK